MLVREGIDKRETAIVRAVVIAAMLVAAACGSTPTGDGAATTSTSAIQDDARAESEGEPDEPGDEGEAPVDEDESTDSAQDDPSEDDDPTGVVVGEAEDTEDVSGDDWILEAPQAGQLTVAGEVIGVEGETTLSLDPVDVVPVSTTTFGDATVAVTYLLPHYDIDRVEVTMPDGTVMDLGAPSLGYPSTAVTIEAQVQNGPLEGAEVSLALTFLAGTTTVEIDGNRAAISGVIGSHTRQQIDHLAQAYPGIDTLVLTDVAGSVEDQIAQSFGRVDAWFTAEGAAHAVRDGGFTTVLPVDGVVSDNGLLLFAGGAQRLVETEGDVAASARHGRFVVREAWRRGPSDWIEDQYSPVHQNDVAVFSSFLGEAAGTGLAMYLSEASVNGPHELTAVEIDLFELTTDPLTLSRVFGPDPVDANHYLLGPVIDLPADRPIELVDIAVEAFNAGQADVEEAPQSATAMVSFDAEQTVAHILIEGGGDDASNGGVATVAFEGDDELGWVVTEIHHRWICSRAVSNGVCL